MAIGKEAVMKKYTSPELEIVKVEAVDVVCASNEGVDGADMDIGGLFGI